MPLPHSYFWNIARYPIMVYNGRVYNLRHSDSEKSSNIININGDSYEFEESETLMNLEALYNIDFSKQIDNVKTSFINEKMGELMEGHMEWKLKSLNKIKDDVQNNQALLVILEKIIPEIEGKNPLKNVEEYANKIGKEEINKFQENVGEVGRIMLDKVIKKIEIRGVIAEEKTSAEYNNGRDRSVLGKYILHNFNIVILSPTRLFIFSKKKSANKANINGYNYFLQEYEEYSSINSLEDTYLDLLGNIFNVEALENVNKTIEGMEEVYRQEALLSQIIKGEEFHGTGGGFYRHSSGKFVFYVKFPQFINRFLDDTYVLFPAGKIAIGATYDPKKKDFSIMRDSITILSRYKHPFIRPFEEGGDESHFCIGTYTMHQNMPGYEKIPQTLIELKTLLMSGYNPYHRNKENIYGHSYSRMTRGEALKKNVPITNEDIIVSENIKNKYKDTEEDE